MRIPPGALIASGILVALGAVFFFQYKDPMILFMALFVALAIVGIAALVGASRSGTFAGNVRVKCRECGALNLEDAKFCSQCGKAV